MMRFREGKIEGVYVVETEASTDERGFFARVFCQNEFGERGLFTDWVQCNLSGSAKVGTLRGMHWQASPGEETKLVQCVSGKVWDCVVDVRPDSETFGAWEAHVLSAENRNGLYIAAGLAHGFQVLEENSVLYYHMSEEYRPELSRGFRYDDPSVGIAWPAPIGVVSERDRSLPLLEDVD